MDLDQFYKVIKEKSNIDQKVAETMTIADAIVFCKKEYNLNLILRLE